MGHHLRTELFRDLDYAFCARRRNLLILRIWILITQKKNNKQNILKR